MTTDPPEPLSSTTPQTTASTDGSDHTVALTWAAVDDHPYVLKGISWTL